MKKYNTEQIHNNSLGKAFNPGMVVAGYIFILGGVIATFTGSIDAIIGGIMISLFGMLISITTHGVLIDIENKKIMHYSVYLFYFRSGNWAEVSEYQSIGVFRSLSGYKVYSLTNRTKKIKEQNYEVYLVSMLPKKRKLVFTAKTENEVLQYGRKLAKAFKMKLIIYETGQKQNLAKLKSKLTKNTSDENLTH